MLNVFGKERGATVTWGPLAAILFTVVTYFVSQMVIGLTLGFVFGLMNWENYQVDQWLDSTTGQFVVMSTSALVTLLFIWLFLDIKRASFKALGFSRGPKWGDVARVVAGFFVYFLFFVIAATIASAVFGVNIDQEQEIGFESAKAGSGGLVLVFVSLVVLPPLVEEILFRGVLFGGLRKKMTFVWATIITSLLFAAPHLLGSSVSLLWIAAVDTFVLSLVLCYVREKTGALWASIGIHAVKNGLAFLYLFVIQ